MIALLPLSCSLHSAVVTSCTIVVLAISPQHWPKVVLQVLCHSPVVSLQCSSCTAMLWSCLRLVQALLSREQLPLDLPKNSNAELSNLNDAVVLLQQASESNEAPGHYSLPLRRHYTAASLLHSPCHCAAIHIISCRRQYPCACTPEVFGHSDAMPHRINSACHSFRVFTFPLDCT